MVYNKEDDEITYQLDTYDFSIDLSLLRKLLKFPPPNLGPRTTYDPFPTDEPLIADLLHLGYDGELRTTSSFVRKNLAGIWYEVYGILTQTLTSKFSGHDKPTKNFLHLFHGFCYDRHIDYAQVIWNELKENVQKKNKAGAIPYIPFVRFLQVIVSVTLKKFNEVTTRDDSEAYEDTFVKTMKTRKGAPDIPAMAFPLSMLLLADQSHPAVIAYKAKHYPPGAGVPTEQPAAIVSEPQQTRSITTVDVTSVVEPSRKRKKSIPKKGSAKLRLIDEEDLDEDEDEDEESRLERRSKRKSDRQTEEQEKDQSDDDDQDDDNQGAGAVVCTVGATTFDPFDVSDIIRTTAQETTTTIPPVTFIESTIPTVTTLPQPSVHRITDEE